MNQNAAPQILAIGSIGIDTIETPVAKREEILGGSASYAGVSASYFTKAALVGVVGTDFPDPFMQIYRNANLDLDGLQIKEGKTFRWSGVYERNMNKRRTISTDLNVFETFSPELPEHYQTIPHVFLGNISPNLQLHVLDQIRNPRFVMVDTMDLWINIARDDLVRVIGRVDLLTLNESEARLLTGESALLKAARKLLDMGPRYILIKKGENGSLLFSETDKFLMPAYPLDNVIDPTGAGDTFAGAFMGALVEQDSLDERSLRRAMLFGSVVAAFGVEDFSLDRLTGISRPLINERADELSAMMTI